MQIAAFGPCLISLSSVKTYLPPLGDASSVEGSCLARGLLATERPASALPREGGVSGGGILLLSCVLRQALFAIMLVQHAKGNVHEKQACLPSNQYLIM